MRPRKVSRRSRLRVTSGPSGVESECLDPATSVNRHKRTDLYLARRWLEATGCHDRPAEQPRISPSHNRTGFFAAAWSSDQPPTSAVATASNARHLPDQPSVVENIRRPLAISRFSRGVTILSESDFSNCVLPVGIQPGTYRVIHEQGSLVWLTLPSDDAAAGGPVVPQSEDFYISRSPRGRLYFIRIEAAPVIATSPVEPPVHR